jgi:hypothetical protein
MNSHRKLQRTATCYAFAAAAWFSLVACSPPSPAAPAGGTTVSTTTATPAALVAGKSSNDLIENFPSPVLLSPLTSPVARDLPDVIPLPKPGSAVVTGVLVDAQTGLSMPQTTVRFALTRDGAFVADVTNSPSAISDAQGRFVIADIKPDNYVVVVGDPYTTYTLAPDLDKKDDVRIFALKPDKINNLDVLIVDYNAIKPK